MGQGRQVDHLDNDRNQHVGVAELAGGAAAQGDQSRTQLLALPRQDIGRVSGEVAFKGIDLLLEPLRHVLEKRFRGSNNVFPGHSGFH